MNLPNESHSKIYFIWVAALALAILATPAYAQLAASPSAVNFTYLSGQAPSPQPVNVTNGGNAVTVANVVISAPQPATVQVATGQIRSTAGLFSYTNFGSQVIVGLDPTVFNSVFNAGGTISANMTLCTSSISPCPAASQIVVPLSLSLGVSTTITTSPTSLPLQAGVGGVSQATGLQVNSSTGVSVSFTATATTTNGVNWLFVSPSGSLVTPYQLTVQASAGSLPQGTYSGSINITPAGGTGTQVPVTFTVGTGSTGLVASPNILTFSTPNNITTPGAQLVTLQTFSGATSYTFSAVSTGNWLTANNLTFSTGVFFNTQANLSVAVNPINLTTGTYTGTITVYDNFNSTQTISVTLTVGSGSSGGLSLSPTSITFSAPTINVNPASTFLSVSSATAGVNYTATVSIFSGGSWLYVGGTTSVSGALPANITVTPNVIGLGSGTYSAQISITTSGNVITSASVPVTLYVGTGGGITGSIAPSSLTFTGQAGSTNVPGAQYIVVNGSGNYSAAATISSGTGNWLQIADQGSGSAPGAVTIKVVPGSLGVGTYSGTVAVTVSGFVTNVPVTLTLTSGANVIGTPGSIYTNAYPGVSPPTQNLYLNMSDGTTNIPYTITSSASWVTINTTGQTLPASVLLTLSPTGLPAGLNSATVTVSVAGAANNPLSIPVILNNQTGGGTGTGALSVSPSSVTFSGAVGGAIAQQSVTVNSSTGFATNYTAVVNPVTGGNWLTVSPTAGTTPSFITLQASSFSLGAGTYNANVILTANGLQQSIPVSLVLGGGTSNTLILTPSSLSFTYSVGGSAPTAQPIQVSSAAGTSVSFTTSATSTGNWLQVTGGGATTGNVASPITVQVSIIPSALTAAGTYNGTINFTPSGGGVQTANVSITVTAPPSISVSPTSLSFTYRSGDQAPASQSVQVTASNSSSPVTFNASVTSGNSWLSANPVSGQTPGPVTASVSPGSLDPGTYTGTIVITGANGAGGSGTVTVTITVTAPLPTITRVVNAASYSGGAIAPGEFVVISGTAIGPNDTQSGGVDSSTGRFQTTLAGVQVLFNGLPAPMIYVTASQVAAIVPYEVAGRFDSTVQVRFRGATSNAITLPITSTLPGIYTQNASGTGPGAILNQNGSVNSPGNPAAKGDVIVIYATGEGIVQTQAGARPVTGTVIPATTPLASIPRPLLPVAVPIGGQPADLYGNFAGSAPGYVVGVFQINAIIPVNLSATGSVPIVISVGSNSSQTGVTVSIR